MQALREVNKYAEQSNLPVGPAYEFEAGQIPATKVVLNEVEVAALMDCVPRTVQEMAREGELPAVKLGRSWRFPIVALLQALNNLALANKPKARAPLLVGVAQLPAKSRRKKLPALLPIPT
jgi:excisionase family DNA binding protein